jgi:predicted PurR-regulated permease PerM
VVGNIRRTIENITEQLGAKEKGDQPDAATEKKPDEQGKQRPGATADAPGVTPEKPLYVSTQTNTWSQVLEVAGPAGEGLASTLLVIVLVVFMLIQRENLRNRIVRLVGRGRLVVTTRALDEGARRISRYLVMQVMVNTGFGVALAVGLFLAGVFTGQESLRYTAVLWGFICGSVRFVPYLGTWVGVGLLLLFCFATLPGWGAPLGIFAFFLVLELLTANVIEPLMFGHSTGSSPLALLLAAAFWTWLWGPVGLVLSTPLTVTLVVLGKYVPQLKFFEVLMGDEPPLSPEVTYYQRLLARDQDEASELIEEYLETHSVDDTYQELFLPALLQAKGDHERGELDDDDLEFLLDATRDIVDYLVSAQSAPASAPPGEDGKEAAPPPKAVLIGCPVHDEVDELALYLLRNLLLPQGYGVEILSSDLLTSEVLARVGTECPPVVCLAALPPGGLAQARYLCKRMRTQCPDVRIVVARWGEPENLERIQKRLRSAGADYVGTSLLESRTQIVPLLQVASTSPPPGAQPPSSELVQAQG